MFVTDLRLVPLTIWVWLLSVLEITTTNTGILHVCLLAALLMALLCAKKWASLKWFQALGGHLWVCFLVTGIFAYTAWMLPARSAVDFDVEPGVEKLFIIKVNSKTPTQKFGAYEFSGQLKAQSLSYQSPSQSQALPVSVPVKLRLETSEPQSIQGSWIEVKTELFQDEYGLQTGRVPKEKLKILAGPTRWQRELLDLKQDFRTALSKYDSDAGALVAGIGIGERSALSPELKENFKTTGLTHLIAVSGGHFSILVGIFIFGIRKLTNNRFVQGGVVFLACCLLVMVVGQEPSVMRAFWMVSSFTLALLLRRNSQGSSGLCLAVLLLLIAMPQWALDYGFLLSVCATAALILLSPVFSDAIARRWTWVPRPLRSAVAVSFSAQLACTPVLLFLQPKITTYSVIANLIVAPVIAPVTVLALLALVLLAFWVPGAEFMLQLALPLAKYVVWVASQIATWPGAQLNWPSGTLGALLFLTVTALLWLCFLRGATWLRMVRVKLWTVGLGKDVLTGKGWKG